MFILWRAPKNEPRKRAKAFPLGSPQGNRDGVAAAGCLCRQEFGKDFAAPFWFENCANMGALHLAKTFAFAWCVILPCWRFTIRTPTQNLNLLILAKTWLPCNRFCAHLGFQGGNPLVPFLSPILCGKAKNRHKFPARACRRHSVSVHRRMAL